MSHRGLGGPRSGSSSAGARTGVKSDGAIVVARPTQWGNPWRVGSAIGVDLDEDDRYRNSAVIVTPGLAVALYREALFAAPISPTVVGGQRLQIVTGLASGVSAETARTELRGHDLACWCPLDQPCHADVLLEVANA